MYGEIAVGERLGLRGRNSRNIRTAAIRTSARVIRASFRKHRTGYNAADTAAHKPAINRTHRQGAVASLVSWGGDSAERKGLPRTSKNRTDALVIILSIAFVAGMAVALVLFQLWRRHPETMANGVPYHTAVALCPPFLLVGSVGGITDSALTLLLTGGTIVFANGSLYAGMAAFAFWAVSSFWPKGQSR